jgi:DNA cross-link repair 1A protein
MEKFEDVIPAVVIEPTVNIDPIIVNTVDCFVEPQTKLVDLKSKRQCPWYKILPGTGFAVDAFLYGKIEGVEAYFLTHFHSDHYMGLAKKWENGIIFGSKATIRLVKLELKVSEKYLCPLEMGLNVVNGINVTLIDANHCPGAVVMLFELPNGKKFLHCGDFRACADHWNNPLLQKRIDSVYLDTTYCDPNHCFPSQETVLKLVAELARKVDKGSSPQSVLNASTVQNFFKIINPVKSENKTLFVVGSYLIGKEKVFMAVAKAVDGKVFTNRRKAAIYHTLENPTLKEILTDDPAKAKVHVVSMPDINSEYLSSLLSSNPQFDRILAFKPTGWTFKKSSGCELFKLTSLRPIYTSQKITVVPVPYSEHSSYLELEQFVRNLDLVNIIPTVNLSASRIIKMKRIFADWQRKS